MQTVHTVQGIFLCILLLTAFTLPGFASLDINGLISKEGFPEVKVLYRGKGIVVLKALKSVDPSRWGRIYTCPLSKGVCVEGYPSDLRDGKALLVRWSELLYLDLKTLRESNLRELPAIARLGEDRTVEIAEGNKVVKVKKGFPKHWVYPRGMGAVPCGDKYWVRGEGWVIFVGSDGRVIKRREGESLCILGNLIDPDRDGKRFTFQPLKEVVRKVNRVLFEGDLSPQFLGDLILFLGWVRDASGRILIVLDPDLKVLSRTSFKGEVRFLVLSGREIYITTYTPKMMVNLYRLDPQNNVAERVLSYRREDPNHEYLFIPAQGGKYLLVIPPYAVCVQVSWQSGCTKFRYYRGKASVITSGGKVLKTMDIPKRAEVYPMNGAFVFCLRECHLVKGNLEVKPLGFKGYSDNWKGEDLKVFTGGEKAFVVFRDGKRIRVPEGCRVRDYARTVFCLYGKTKAELRDLETGDLLGKTSSVPYPDHLFKGLALKEGIVVLDAKDSRIIDYRKPECHGLPLRKVVFKRDRFYTLYSGKNKVCMEVFRIDVD